MLIFLSLFVTVKYLPVIKIWKLYSKTGKKREKKSLFSVDSILSIWRNIWRDSFFGAYGERAAESYYKSDNLFVQTGCLSSQVCLITDVLNGECDGRWLMHDLHNHFSFYLVTQQLVNVCEKIRML